MNNAKNINRRITNTDYILFIGAGASYPLGCLPTEPFLSHLPKRIFDLYKEQGTDYSSAEKVSNFLNPLFQLAAKHYGIKQPDSEVVLDFLTHLIDVCKELGGVSAQIIKAGTDFPGAVKGLKNLEGLIQRVIVEHYSRSNAELAYKLYKPLLKAMSSSKNVVPIFTTNYDWVFEQLTELYRSDYELIDGFESSPMGLFWSSNVFKQFRARRNKINLILFKLHGSTSWYKDANSDSIRKFPEPAPELAGSRAVLIYPTQVKAHLVQSEPFKTSYNYFRETLLRTNLVIVIGFSFRDPAVTLDLRNSLSGNENLKLLIVEPDLNVTSQKFKLLLGELGLLEMNWETRLHVIRGKFGDDTVTARISTTIGDIDNWDSLPSFDTLKG